MLFWGVGVEGMGFDPRFHTLHAPRLVKIDTTFL